jgi:hypothetical protein
MGLRFRKSFRVLPGVKINLSKTGTSLSLGGRGASVNLGRKRVRTTVGLPGSGLSYSEDASYGDAEGGAAQGGGGLWKLLGMIALGLAFAGYHLLSK